MVGRIELFIGGIIFTIVGLSMAVTFQPTVAGMDVVSQFFIPSAVLLLGVAMLILSFFKRGESDG